MLISYYLYLIISIFFVLSLAVLMFRWKKSAGILFLIFLAIPILLTFSRTFPLVYRIKSCDRFQPAVLLFEKDWLDGQRLKLNNPFVLWKNLHNYVINESSREIEIESLTYYGPREYYPRSKASEEDKFVSLHLAPMTATPIPFERIDYLFVPAPQRIEMNAYTKDETKLRLFCR